MADGGLVELRERVYSVVRDSARTFVVESDVDLWLREGMEDLSSRLKLHQAQKTQADSAISSNSIAIPSDYVELISLEVTDSGTTTDFVKFVDDDVWTSHEENGSDLSQMLGRVFNGNFELYPTPDGTTYTLRYWASTNSSVTNFTGTLKTRLVNYARSHAKYKEGDQANGDRYMALYEAGLPIQNILGKNHPPGPLYLYPARSPFEQSDYTS